MNSDSARRRRPFIFFLLVLLGLALITEYKLSQIAGRFASITSTVAIFGAMTVSQFAYRLFPRQHRSMAMNLSSWTGSLAMSVWSTFLLLSLIGDAIGFVGGIVGTAIGATGPVPTDGPMQIASLAGALAIAAIGLGQALAPPKIRRVDVPIDGLPPDLDGLRITQLSDIHIGPTIRTRSIKRIVARANSTAADLIVVTGDLADARAEFIQSEIAELGNLRARYGRYYVTGNHEYYWGVDSLIRAMERSGFVALVNDSRMISIGKTQLQVGGVTDPAGGSFFSPESRHHAPDVRQAGAQDSKTSAPVDLKILLSHRPGLSREAEREGFQLMLSGHTHSGQYFPFSLLIPLAHRIYRGLNRVGGLWVYVNPGTGYWGPANRLFVPSEITVLHLSARPLTSSPAERLATSAVSG